LTPPVENLEIEQQGERVTGLKRTQKRKNPSLALDQVKRKRFATVKSQRHTPIQIEGARPSHMPPASPQDDPS